MVSKGSNNVQKLDKEIRSYVNKLEDEFNYVVNDKEITYNNFFSDKLLINYSIRLGVPYSLFSLIKSISPFSETQWANFLDVSTKSLTRYKQTLKKFKPSHSEKILSLAEIINLGLDVFGDMDSLKRWFETPNYALGSSSPLELLANSYGRELVTAELTRINYGILA